MKEPATAHFLAKKVTLDQEDLRELSQCIFNIRSMIKAHCIEPIEEDKEINGTYYFPEIHTLSTLLKTRTGHVVVQNQEALLGSLTNDLLLNECKTDRSKKQIEIADDCTSIASGEIQRNRIYKIKPTTGLVDGPLKDYLTGFISRKQKITEESKKLKVEIIDLPLASMAINIGQHPPLTDITVGQLVYKVGKVYFGVEWIKMRSQLNLLCHLFMRRHNELIEYYTITENIVASDKRATVSKKNVNKYVSELHILLKKYFHKKVIFNDGKVGYIFDIERSS